MQELVYLLARHQCALISASGTTVLVAVSGPQEISTRRVLSLPYNPVQDPPVKTTSLNCQLTDTSFYNSSFSPNLYS
jgi:serine phosphatase RsbU (regulator of sigma subunit)